MKVVLWFDSIGLGDSCTPVMCKVRFAEVDAEVCLRLRSALKEEARGAAMVAVSSDCVQDG